jgi:hypothetical protein
VIGCKPDCLHCGGDLRHIAKYDLRIDFVPRKFRRPIVDVDVWDVWYLVNRLNAQPNRDMVKRKFADCGTSDVEAKAKQRLDELTKASTMRSFLQEMRRFLPAKRVAEMDGTGLHRAILAASSELVRRAVLPIPPSEAISNR